MTKRHSLLVLVMFAIAVPAAAQIDPDPDGVGIYADLGGTINAVQQASGVLELHILHTNTAAPEGQAGWELALDYTGPLSYLGHLIPYNNVNVGVFPEFVVGHAQAPQPPAPIIRLATLTFLVTADQPAEIFIKGASKPSGGSLRNGLPVYADGVEPYDLSNMYPSSGSTTVPVFRLNAEAPVAVEAESWGHVKALFR